eukprot:NODE_363_length_2168_cov_129.320434_g289_i0.p1 GENE.NODE_363_length_2168_cov_129.320434_g289_i0~~NODE_363_length_2168_cov_129.320434_g289_i0.p1  ORF type:complete len:701 (+),score=139.97 NODE_363_length_2168_cov_129.320434_g289_i0:37-2103(+)
MMAGGGGGSIFGAMSYQQPTIYSGGSLMGVMPMNMNVGSVAMAPGGGSMFAMGGVGGNVQPSGSFFLPAPPAGSVMMISTGGGSFGSMGGQPAMMGSVVGGGGPVGSYMPMQMQGVAGSMGVPAGGPGSMNTGGGYQPGSMGVPAGGPPRQGSTGGSFGLPAAAPPPVPGSLAPAGGAPIPGSMAPAQGAGTAGSMAPAGGAPGPQPAPAGSMNTGSAAPQSTPGSMAPAAQASKDPGICSEASCKAPVYSHPVEGKLTGARAGKCGEHVPPGCKRQGCKLDLVKDAEYCKYHKCPKCGKSKSNRDTDCGGHAAGAAAAGGSTAAPASAAAKDGTCPDSGCKNPSFKDSRGSVTGARAGKCSTHMGPGTCKHPQCCFDPEPGASGTFCKVHTCPGCKGDKSSTKEHCDKPECASAKAAPAAGAASGNCKESGCSEKVWSDERGHIADARAGKCMKHAGPGSCKHPPTCPFDPEPKSDGKYCKSHTCPKCKGDKSSSKPDCGCSTGAPGSSAPAPAPAPPSAAGKPTCKESGCSDPVLDIPGAKVAGDRANKCVKHTGKGNCGHNAKSHCPFDKEGGEFCVLHSCPTCKKNKSSSQKDCGAHGDAAPSGPCKTDGCKGQALPTAEGKLAGFCAQCLYKQPPGTCGGNTATPEKKCPFDAKPPSKFCKLHTCEKCPAIKSSQKPDCGKHA